MFVTGTVHAVNVICASNFACALAGASLIRLRISGQLLYSCKLNRSLCSASDLEVCDKYMYIYRFTILMLSTVLSHRLHFVSWQSAVWINLSQRCTSFGLHQINRTNAEYCLPVLPWSILVCLPLLLCCIEPFKMADPFLATQRGYWSWIVPGVVLSK